MRRATTALIPLLMSCGTTPAIDRPGVFVLGIDGADPVILERMMGEGRLPNFAKLAKDGTFQRLGTSNPPQSPVAWSSFVTGMDPGGHGIFDFVHRDPHTYAPISSATAAVDDPGTAVELFGWVLPLSGGAVSNNRGGKPWWDMLIEHGVDVEVYRIPGNYPVPDSDAKVLSGMGTVDMRGGYGTYTLYTDRPVERDDPNGDITLVSVQDYDLDGSTDTVESTLKGPPDIFHLRPGQIPGAGDYLTARVTVHVDPETDTGVVKVGTETALLREGEWSDWMQVSFDALPFGMMPLQGAVRFYAMELRPTFKVYASPVNLSVEAPPQPVTSPDDFASDLYESLGQFYTQGMPEETNALKDGVFSDDDYIKQVGLVQQDTREMLHLALERFEPGDATFVYLSDIDLQSHMLWRHGDPKEPERGHPARDPVTAEQHAHDIERFYEQVDAELGRFRARLPPDTLLIVMSDHGFETYTRKFHLNAWLRDEGYLVLEDGKRTGHTATDVDWSKTKAFGIGFNGLYLNLAGREAQGIVRPEDAQAVKEEIMAKLEGLRDPVSGEAVVLDTYSTDVSYKGDRRAEAPDLIVGYAKGYGCSDESTLGEIVEPVLEDNTSRWSGNHLIDPSLVPGILFVNGPVQGNDHDLTDVTATLLDYYGVPLAPGMVGTSFLSGSATIR